jgi:hypothetical protein
MCIGFPTAPRGGLTVKANDLWKALNDKATILKPSNIKGPTPFSSSMFMFGTFSNTRGKKDLPQENAPLHFPPSTLLDILANDGILCWQARLDKSVVVPHSPSMDALIHSKSTTSVPYAAESGVSPPDSVLDEEKSILAAIQKSLSSVEAEVFHQGPNCGSTHPNLIFPLPCRLAPLPTMVFSAGRHDFTNQLSCPVNPAWTRSFTANPLLPPHLPLSQVLRHLLLFLFLTKKNLSWPPSKNPCLQLTEVFCQGPNGGGTHPNLIFPLSRRLASLPTTVLSAGRHDFTNQSSCPIHPAWMRSFTANPLLLPHPPLNQVFRHLLLFLFLTKKNLSLLLSKNPCLQ